MSTVNASAIVATETTRAVEDGVGAVVVLPNLDPRLDKVRAQRTCRDLQFQTVERHAIVVADLTLLLHAENLAEIDTRTGDESAAVLLGLDGKAGVVDRKIDITKKQIGRIHRGNPGQGQFLGQPVLQRMKDTFGAAPRLRRIGCDMFDTQMRQRPADLGQGRAIDRTASRRRMKVM